MGLGQRFCSSRYHSNPTVDLVLIFTDHVLQEDDFKTSVLANESTTYEAICLFGDRKCGCDVLSDHGPGRLIARSG